MVLFETGSKIKYNLINLAGHLESTLLQHLKIIRSSDTEKCQSVLQTFHQAFRDIHERVQNQLAYGHYILPLYQSYAFFLARITQEGGFVDKQGID